MSKEIYPILTLFHRYLLSNYISKTSPVEISKNVNKITMQSVIWKLQSVRV